MDVLQRFDEVWLVDFEFRVPPGERPDPVCLVAREFKTGRTIREWGDRLAEMPRPPFRIDPKVLFVAYYASAEFGCFLALGWPMPARVLDLFFEFRNHTNGRGTVAGNGLLGALAYFGLPSIDVAEKSEMRELAQRQGPHTEAERQALLDYCESDVLALARLLPAMLPLIDLPRSLLRGRYAPALARMEWAGVPIDVTTLAALRRHWDTIKSRLIRDIDTEYGVYVPSGARVPAVTSRFGQAVDHAASELGIDPVNLATAAVAVFKERHRESQELQAAIRAARKTTGLTTSRMSRWENSGQDYSTWPNLDVQARELAGAYPILGIGRGYVGDEGFDDTDYAPRLWELLRTTNDRPMHRHAPEIIGEAVDRVADIPNGDYYQPGPLSFSRDRFAEWLVRECIPWPRLESGELALDDDTFRQMARTHQVVAPLRELRHALGEMRLFSDLAVGSDGRNRCLLSPLQSITGRNQPSNAKYIFGPSVWLRSLIQPAPGMAIAYIDWCQQEFGIAAALSRDEAMKEAYASGDPYLTFAKQAGAVPAEATKASHPTEREQFKVCALAVLYGMGSQSLSRSLNQPEAYARELLRLHRKTYPNFWAWSEAAVNHALLLGWLQTVFGWRVHVGPRANPRSLANFPMQANGAEMLRLACCMATEQGITVCAPVHDAVLVEAGSEAIDEVVQRAQGIMVEASRIVLTDFELRSDAKIIRHPERYSDPRGERMWNSVMGILQDLESPETGLSGTDF